MSRVGKQPIPVPSGITVTIDSDKVDVAGSKGSLSQPVLDGITIKQDGDTIIVSRVSDEAKYRANHGLMRTLISNMIEGVSSGYSKKLEVNGVGYRVSLQGNALKLALGFSHDITFPLPEGVTAQVEQNVITLSGIDKQRIGQTASDIRELRKPEPYKGKGIKYENEYIIRKSGKSGKEK